MGYGIVTQVEGMMQDNQFVDALNLLELNKQEFTDLQYRTIRSAINAVLLGQELMRIQSEKDL